MLCPTNGLVPLSFLTKIFYVFDASLMPETRALTTGSVSRYYHRAALLIKQFLHQPMQY